MEAEPVSSFLFGSICLFACLFLVVAVCLFVPCSCWLAGWLVG